MKPKSTKRLIVEIVLGILLGAALLYGASKLPNEEPIPIWVYLLLGS